MANEAQKKQVWLKSMGLVDMPFSAGPVALQEPHLHSVFINTPVFQHLHNPNSTYIFAEPGQGKTALRVELMDSLRKDPKSFPIFHSPAHVYTVKREFATPEWHSGQIIREASIELLQRLIIDPRRISNPEIAAEVKSFFLKFFNFGDREIKYLADPSFVSYIFGIGAPYMAAPKVNKPNVLALQTSLRKAEKVENKVTNIVSLSRLLGKLGFKSAYLLLDEFDGVMETAMNPDAQLELLVQVEKNLRKKTDLPFHIKAFIPDEVRSLVARSKEAEFITLESNYEFLWKLLASRLAWRSRGRITDFAQLCDENKPAFGSDDVIRTISELIGKHSPRETLFFANSIFYAHMQANGPDGKLNLADLASATVRYREENIDRFKKKKPKKRL